MLKVIIIFDFILKSFKIHFSSPIASGLDKDFILLNNKNKVDINLYFCSFIINNIIEMY